MAHVCDRCGEGFDFPSRLRRHRGRKEPCDGPRPHVCRACGRGYAHAAGLSRHSANCLPPRPGAPSKRRPVTLRAEIASLRAEIAEMSLALAQAPAGRTIQVSPTVVNNTTNNIMLNAFGNEGGGRIDRPLVKQILDSALQAGGTPVRSSELAFFSLFRDLHSNADHPEDLTCYLPAPNSRSARVHTSEPNRWDTITLDEAVCNMSSRTISQLVEFQPFVDADKYGPVMRALLNQEDVLKEGRRLAPILYSNKEKLETIGLL